MSEQHLTYIGFYMPTESLRAIQEGGGALQNAAIRELNSEALSAALKITLPPLPLEVGDRFLQWGDDWVYVVTAVGQFGGSRTYWAMPEPSPDDGGYYDHNSGEDREPITVFHSGVQRRV